MCEEELASTSRRRRYGLARTEGGPTVRLQAVRVASVGSTVHDREVYI